MRINWKVRFQNRAFVTAFATTIVTFVYQMLALFDVVPAVSSDMVVNVLGVLLNVLVAVGIMVDPTTDGISDSDRAMSYEKPYKGE